MSLGGTAEVVMKDLVRERTEAVLNKRFARVTTVAGVKEGLLVSAT